MAEVVLSASDLTRAYGERVVVDNVTMNVTRGRAFGLLGPNGAGKTTTVRLLNGLIAPSSGSVSVFGEPLTPTSADSIRQRIGVQTDTELYATLTARENLRVWGSLYGLSGSRLRTRVDDILAVMRLTERADTLVGSFSKGMRQKIAVGRALVHEPELLYLDEPTAGLDPEATEDLISYLDEMTSSTGVTVIICTHQLHGLEALCDDVGILVNGRMAASGDITSLIHDRWPNPAVRFTTSAPAETLDVIRALPLASAEVADDTVTATLAGGGEVERVVAALVARGIGVHAVEPQRPSLHDLYFATVADERVSVDSLAARASKEIAA